MILMQILLYTVCTALLSATAIYWFWWFIGSPAVNEYGECSSRNGRIFSFWGRFISQRYNDVENQKYKEFLAKFPNKEPKEIYDPQHLNLWKIAGCCVYCMAVWAALILFFGWYQIAIENLEYSGGFLATSAIWLFYTVLTLTFIKREI